MKLRLIFCLAIPLLGACQSESTPAKLKLLNGYTYYVDSLQNSTDTTLTVQKWYDDNHLLVREKIYWSDEKGNNYRVNHYDAAGKLAKKELVLKDSTYISITEFERDERGELLKQIMNDNGEKVNLTHRNTYNAKGLLTQSVMGPETPPPGFDAASQKSRSEYTYDAQGNMLELKQSMGRDLFYQQKNTYDSRNNRVSEMTYRPGDGSMARFLFTYNTDNQKIQQQYFDQAGLASETSYTWTGNIITRECTRYMEDKGTECTFYVWEK